MRAVLIATGFCPELDPLTRYRPTPLLNIADKPIIFYVIEFLVRNGIRKFDLVLSNLPAAIEEKLNDGKRWGISITYHLARSPEHPFAPLLPAIESWSEEPIVLGLGDCLPDFEHESFNQIEKRIPTLMMYPANEWSGWGIIDKTILEKLNRETKFNDLPSSIGPGFNVSTVHPFLSTQTLMDLKNSNFKMLKNTRFLHLFPSTAHMVENGIWISRAVSLHPDAKLAAPVFIGELCQIKASVCLGPNAIIENNCIIDTGSTIEDSIICQRSYVGEKLEIQDSIVDRNLLINLAHGTALHIRDDFILSELTPLPLIRYPFRILARVMAAFFIVLLSPIYLYLKMTCRLEKIPMICLPAPEDPSQWQSFDWLSFGPKPDGKMNNFQKYFRRIPLLLNIFRGEAHFVGVIPRSIEDTEKLPPDWQKLYLKSKVGLITLADLDHGAYYTADDLYASETYYATQMNLWFDIKLCLRWMKKKIRAAFYSPLGRKKL